MGVGKPADSVYRYKLPFFERPFLMNIKYDYDVLTVKDPAHLVLKIRDQVTKTHEEQLALKLKAFAKQSLTESSERFPKELIYDQMPVIVKNKDGSMARAELIAMIEESNEAKVFLIDLGQSSSVPLDDVLPITPSLLRIPKIGYKCRLSQVSPLNGKWSDEAKNKKLFVGKKHEVTMLEYDPTGKVFNVALVVDGVNLAVKFFHSALGLPAPLKHFKEDGRAYPVFDYSSWIGLKIVVFGLRAFYDEKDKVFKVVLQTDAEHTGSIEKEIAEYLEKSSVKDETVNVFPGVACLAKYDGGDYFRAEIIEGIGKDKVRIEYVDYKEEAVVSPADLRIIPSSLLEKPEAAVVCQLTELLKNDDFKDLEKLKELVDNKDLYAVIDACEPDLFGPDLLVSLYEPTPFGSGVDKPFPELLGVKMKAEEIDAVCQPLQCGNPAIGNFLLKPRCPDGNRFYPGANAFISYIGSWGSIYLQTQDDIDEAEQISKELKHFYDHGGCYEDFRKDFSASVKAGDYVATFLAEEEGDINWYRCKILEVNPEKRQVLVHCIDYGSDDWVSLNDIYPLHLYFFKDAPKAFEVEMKNL